MASANTPPREAERLAAVHRTHLLDTPPEPEFDELVEMATAICGVEMGVVSLIDERRQWFKAAIGFPLPEVERNLTFCQHTILQDDLLMIEDARVHPLVRDNPFVLAQDGVRFYAGVNVQSPDGHNVGTLCVFDNKPHTLNATQRAALRTLASQANARIELRMQRLQLAQALAAAQEAQSKLEASDRRFKAFMNSGPFVGYLKDSAGRYVSYNHAFAKLFGVSFTEWLGKRDEEVFPASFAATYRENDQRVMRTLETMVVTEDTLNADGTTTSWRSYKFPCPADDGSTWIGGFSLDVTQEIRREKQLEEANRQLAELAVTDALTGLPNRRLFEDRLQLEFARSRRKRLGLSVLMIDVDNFKLTNDTFGHIHGDEVLQQLAVVLREAVRETDLAARYGGEEFVILLPEADETQAMHKAAQILEALKTHTWAHGPCTVSIGAAALDPATPNPSRLVTLADEALYAAKRAGKNRAVGYGAYFEAMMLDLQVKTKN